jgi:hypothetical protein
VSIAAEIYGGAADQAYIAALIVSVKYKNVCQKNQSAESLTQKRNCERYEGGKLNDTLIGQA